MKSAYTMINNMEIVWLWKLVNFILRGKEKVRMKNIGSTICLKKFRKIHRSPIIPQSGSKQRCDLHKETKYWWFGELADRPPRPHRPHQTGTPRQRQYQPDRHQPRRCTSEIRSRRTGFAVLLLCGRKIQQFFNRIFQVILWNVCMKLSPVEMNISTVRFY